ncbi:MAG: LysM peptidoglycan-binding domain-containing protein, partial [Myxococcota bacterium]
GDGRSLGSGFGPVPPFHVVRRGDTLWDICWFYFNNPWEWPKVWSYNGTITNPHWIYPGDLVRLYPQDLQPSGTATVDPDQPEPEQTQTPLQPTPVRRTELRLRQTAFVDRDELDFAGTVAGSVQERTLLSLGDEIYIEYTGKPPQRGKRYAVYTRATEVRHPDTGRVVGDYVRILGELEVISVKRDKRARAIITDSVDVIERGALVGPLQRTFRTVEPQRNKTDLQGTIVAMLGTDQLIGEGQIVFIDKGSRDGVEVGNRMFVVRRGDALEDRMSASHNVGQDDRRFPSRAVGEITVVQRGKRASVALVTLSLRAIGIGDKVLMRKAR